MSTWTHRDGLRWDAEEAVRKFLTDETAATDVFDAIAAFDDAEGTDCTLSTQFCEATGFDPEPLLDRDGDGTTKRDVDLLLDLLSELASFECAETPDPFDTWAEARGER